MKSDYELGLEFILANKKLIIDQCSGPSEKHVVQKSFEMLSCGSGELPEPDITTYTKTDA